MLGFLDKDKLETIQPYDDALVITHRIGGYDVKRVLMDQGSAVEVMYPELYKGLNLKLEDLTPYDSPLVSFKGKTVTPMGQIRLPIQPARTWWKWISSWLTLIRLTQLLWPGPDFTP